ncbi:MAG TPA: AMP-binding protein [Candidatus Acidoferrum sp.]|nr:AMP-binding protein [Candidatus Acidoferrum sp.]
MTPSGIFPFQTLTADILGERARISPQRIALVSLETSRRFSYAEMNERALQCARMLAVVCRMGVGERVGILSGNRVEFLEVFGAAAKGGTVLVALNKRYTAHELRFILNDAGVKTLFYEGDCAATVAELRGDTSVEHFVALDEPATPGDLSYCAACDSVAEAAWEAPPCGGESLCCLLYTSGTTGKPKGVMIPHRMIASNGYNTAVCWQLRETDVTSVFTPLYHAGGLFAFLVPVWTAGGTIVLHREFQASQVWRTIAAERVTVALGVPTILQMLLDAPEFAHADVARLRWLISGGAPLSGELVEAYQRRGIVLKQGFGMTEVGVNCFTMSEAEAHEKVGSVGKPMLFTQARVVHADGRLALPEEVGELQIRGPHVCQGYWNNESATQQAIDKEGWFHTGDLAQQDADGFFYISGRSKDMYISGGVNVYPAEIEMALLAHPEVKDVAIVGVPDAVWGEVGAAYIVARSPENPPGDLAAFLGARVAKFKIPKTFHFVATLPRTAYGKVMKHALQSPAGPKNAAF